MPKLAAAVDRPAILVAGSAALCVVLLSLAWLQYRWIGQLSDAERARLQARLHESGRAFADEFDGLLLEVAQQVLAPRGPFESPEQRLRVWLEFARYPRLIEGFFVVEDGQVRSVAVSDGRTPEPERIPSAVRAVLDAPGPPAPMGRGLGPPLVEGPGVLAMMTIRGRPNAGGPPPGVFGFRRPGPRPMPAERPVWVIAVIDLGVVTRELLPELSRRHFGPDWQVTVRALRDDRIVYQSALQPHRPEFTTPLLEIRPGRPEAEQRPPGPGRPPREPRWQLEVAPTRGTLEELVDAARTRNLALSGAALGLLCAAAGLLMLSLARARRLSRLRMELVAGVSHELRTPVAVIVSAADNLADGVVTTPEQVRRYGQTLRREGLRLAEMVEEVLGFAGLDAGRVRLQLEAVPPMAIVDAAAEACRHELESAGCRLEIDIEEPDALPPVEADQEWLARCLRNLIANAIRYGDGKWVGVNVAAVGSQVVFTVEDRGQGIAAADLPNLFKPFHRGRNARKQNAGGAGLGLSLVDRIARAHGGAVSVDSAEGRGSRFALSIPKAVALP